MDRLFVQGKVGAAIFADPGLGKTAMTLRFLETLKAMGELPPVLLVAPKRVALSVWEQEIKKWGFDLTTQNLAKCDGAQRLNRLYRQADLYIMTPDTMPWLADRSPYKPFKKSILIIDESTKFKSWSAKRTSRLRKLLPLFRHRILLTGTPAPNSLADLFSQVFIMDEGRSLGTSLRVFRENYMWQDNIKGFWTWVMRPGVEEHIYNRLGSMVIRLDAESNLAMPPLVENEIWIDLPNDVLEAYKILERQLFVELHDAINVIAGSAGAKYHLCRGVANGGIYEHLDDGDRIEHAVHEAKTNALEDLVEELSGKPLLVAYHYQHDLKRIQERFPHAETINGQTKSRDLDKVIRRWNAGAINLLACQPQSMAHGLNLQGGGCRDICWYSLTDRFEDYTQANRRVYRQGVAGQVRVHHLMARDTIDVAVWDRIQHKDASQTALLAALKAYRDRVLSGR